MTLFRGHYNSERPHEALGGFTPAERYRPGHPLLLPTVDLPPADHTPPGALHRKTSIHGRFGYAGRNFDLGQRFAAVTVGLIREGRPSARLLRLQPHPDLSRQDQPAPPHTMNPCQICPRDGLSDMSPVLTHERR